MYFCLPTSSRSIAFDSKCSIIGGGTNCANNINVLVRGIQRATGAQLRSNQLRIHDTNNHVLALQWLVQEHSNYVF